MKKTKLLNLLAPVIACLPLVYLALIWHTVPETVPLHFNERMEPDRYGNRTQLWLLSGIIAAVSAGVYFLLANIQKIDPRRRNSPQSGVYLKLAFGMLVFTTLLNFIILHTSATGALTMNSLIFPLVGLLMAFLGNNMNSIKPNYFAGIRLPWTLSDDDNWRRTHRLAGKLWFAGGLMIVILGLLIPTHSFLPFFIAIILILVVIPAVYSYRIFRSKSG